MSEIKKNGAPTIKTIGAVGDIYTDISTGAQYKCTGSYGIAGQIECEWKMLLKKDGEVTVTSDTKSTEVTKNAEPIIEEKVAMDSEPETAKEEQEEVKEVVEEKPKNQNHNPNRNKSNNHSNNRTDYASKFKG